MGVLSGMSGGFLGFMIDVVLGGFIWVGIIGLIGGVRGVIG